MAGNKKPRKAARVAPVAKKKVSVKAPKPKLKPKAKRRQVIPRDQVPSSMAPPSMPDTRPVRPQANQTTPQAGSSLAPSPQTGSSPGTTATLAPVPGPVNRPTAPGQSAAKQHTGRRLQGAACTWIGRESEATDGPGGVLTCPSCANHVIESTQDDGLFWMGIDQYELGAYASVNPPPRPHPGYRAFMEWIVEESELGRCWPTVQEAAGEYERVTGRKVDATR